MNKWINWSQSNGYDTQYGEMPIENIKSCLADFRNAAIKYQEETDADHVIYAAKEFDDNDKLIMVRFYQNLALDDKEYEKRVNACNYQVYAIHKN